jgi:hypothetical protein
MKQVIVGTYEIGWNMVQIVLMEGKGGSFYILPGDIDCPRIKIGADQESWTHIVETFLHEAEELAMAKLFCRYSSSDEIASDQHAYHFFLTHPQFSEVQALTADLLVRCWDDLYRKWRIWVNLDSEVEVTSV